MARITLDHLRRYAVARTLTSPTTLLRAIDRLGFVQADPIRAPARAQDLILRHRVKDYLAGDLERRYPRLPVEEDCLVNYGFLPRRHLALMHPRVPHRVWDAATRRRAEELLAFVRERKRVHPREVEAHFAHGRITNYWGGSSAATTHLLDGMHYRGLLRVARRDKGIRIYEAAAHPPVDDSPAAQAERAAALMELVVRQYAPLPASSLGFVVRMLDYGAPQLGTAVRHALRGARERLAGAEVDGLWWYWPADENPASRRHLPDDAVRLLAPFDPVVWDRTRFQLLWGWVYKFEAYTPAAQRRFGYYALPMLWRDQVIGWANLSLQGGRLAAAAGYVEGAAPAEPGFHAALTEELAAVGRFLGLERESLLAAGQGIGVS
ncbi:winged helix DNA-binding domain-containing protein [Aquabacterium sp. A7-Y]|uniref:DNA glycosylase AlkZ-like family protein n=1 Tax=Aquabacterium sp. A7-Y TaxID=1349605 RepID=UPI00223E4A9D|nr:crosslink repair DNA glycosylase YcaQ family protein [Aquabacterium sp. A7-Y]MCW7539745.1 winged helix DNA-binding domain-containing protein [Aquabacterium sp. A7-Y]